MSTLTTEEAELRDIGQADFSAVLTAAQVAAYEADQSVIWGPKRRMALATLSRSRAELLQGFGVLDNGPDVLLDLAENIGDWLDHLKASVELGG